MDNYDLYGPIVVGLAFHPNLFIDGPLDRSISMEMMDIMIIYLICFSANGVY